MSTSTNRTVPSPSLPRLSDTIATTVDDSGDGGHVRGSEHVVDRGLGSQQVVVVEQVLVRVDVDATGWKKSFFLFLKVQYSVFPSLHCMPIQISKKYQKHYKLQTIHLARTRPVDGPSSWCRVGPNRESIARPESKRCAVSYSKTAGNLKCEMYVRAVTCGAVINNQGNSMNNE